MQFGYYIYYTRNIVYKLHGGPLQAIFIWLDDTTIYLNSEFSTVQLSRPGKSVQQAETW